MFSREIKSLNKITMLEANHIIPGINEALTAPAKAPTPGTTLFSHFEIHISNHQDFQTWNTWPNKTYRTADEATTAAQKLLASPNAYPFARVAKVSTVVSRNIS